ncbi:catechol 2,3-dioxygenase-like lactoylglutathione lyase family enzyme [Alkalibacillus flavidus]|uniref:Catechol 2,3-dioxygenase-like lactoylglutathione lyase family enzyme n=1 Tax=Alkalibacillus flavidus TaxID=546021 RepID=A0ABV2KXB2_9BACI
MSFTFKRIDHVQLAAPRQSEAEARQFFAGVLGFDEIEKPDALKANGGVWFAFGDQQLHVGVEESFYPAEKAHPAFEITGLDAFKQHLDDNLVTYTEDQKLPGAKRIYVHDPFGNRLEVLEWLD